MAAEFIVGTENDPTPYRCPICERGTLVQIEDETWDCSRGRCNSQFFIDSVGTLNVRDKPRRLTSRLWGALREARGDAA